MPKMKTKRGAAKRFKLTASGRIKRRCAGARHILSNKNRKQKRRLTKGEYIHSADEHRVSRMLPYA